MNNVIIKNLGLIEYEKCFQAMQSFTQSRDEQTGDEIWILEHPAIYSQGMNGKAEHIINTENIPVIQSDRGGQVTYHGPGQLIVYCLFDLKRCSIGIKGLVHALEESVILLLKEYKLVATRRKAAPGVYINGKKISALGVRVKRGCCYHGLALNIDMELAPFKGINPCGYADLEVTQLSDCGVKDDRKAVIKKLLPILGRQLNFTYTISDNSIDQFPNPRAA